MIWQRHLGSGTVRTGTYWAINAAKLSFVQLGVMAQYLRMLLSRHVNYLLFHAPSVQSHSHWLEIVDLPDDEALLTARKSVIDQRIALMHERQRPPTS